MTSPQTPEAPHRGDTGHASPITIDLTDDWRSFVGTQGGRLLGHLLQAAETTAGRPVRTASVQFLGAALPGPATVHTHLDRVGATTTSVRVQLSTQDATTRAVAQILTATRRPDPLVDHRPDPSHPDSSGPDSVERSTLPVDYVPFSRHIEYRPIGSGRLFGAGPQPRLTAWVRLLVDVEPIVATAVLLDALPPSLFAVVSRPINLPTVELTAHLVSPPPPAGTWLLLDQATLWHDGDLALDDASLTDAHGTLIAQCRQTRRIPADTGARPSRVSRESR